LTVTVHGAGAEMITSGCCSPQLHVTFRLSNLRGTAAQPAATATVTTVVADAGFTYDPGEPHPRVGEVATIRIRAGVLDDPFTGTTYCAPGVHECGA
jgi:hypothetical protein